MHACCFAYSGHWLRLVTGLSWLGPDQAELAGSKSGRAVWTQPKKIEKAEIGLKAHPDQSVLGQGYVLQDTPLFFTLLFSPFFILISSKTGIFDIRKFQKISWTFLNLFVGHSCFFRFFTVYLICGFLL
jgi:hypothetical protein